MRCHYELLGVAQDADDDEIRQSYRKLALQTGPDKHPEDFQCYPARFRKIQAAYEILSDPQERCWYDAHRDVILASDEEFVDDTLNIMHFFNPGIYYGFGDDDLSFYAVYRSAFQKIAEEDEPFVDGGIYEAPDFGNSVSPFEGVVKPFYCFWLSYCTKKTYIWMEKYDLRQARDLDARRLMEMENKNLRDGAKQKRNEEVRALADFVRKRDKRLHRYRKQLEQHRHDEKKATERTRVEAMRERLKKGEAFEERDSAAFHNMKSQLEQIQYHFDKKSREESEDSDNEGEHVPRFRGVLGGHDKSKTEGNDDLVKQEVDDALLRNLHFQSDADLETLQKDEPDRSKGARSFEVLRCLDMRGPIVKDKNPAVLVPREPTFEEYARDVDGGAFGDHSYDSIRLAKLRKPIRQGSHDYKERKKKSKVEKVVTSHYSDDETKRDNDKRDLFARDSLALPRKKSSKSKQLRQQAEKRRTDDFDSAPFLDASLGESSVYDSIRISKNRASTKDKILKPKGSVDSALESKSSGESGSETEDKIIASASSEDAVNVSEDMEASSSGLPESTGSEEDIVDADNDSVTLDYEACNKEPVLGHSPLTDSIRIGKVKITHHGKASLKQKKQKSRHQDAPSDHGLECSDAGNVSGGEYGLCSVCGKGYPSRNELLEHMLIERHAAVKEIQDKTKRTRDKILLE